MKSIFRLEVSRGALRLAVLALVLTITAAGACYRADAYTPPPATFILEAAPIAVDAFAVYDEWNADPAACRAKYTDQKLYCRVDVKRMSPQMRPAGSDAYVQIGPIKFLVAVPDNLNNVRIGSKVEVVGKLSGMEGYTLVFSDCWVRVIIPQLTAGY